MSGPSNVRSSGVSLLIGDIKWRLQDAALEMKDLAGKVCRFFKEFFSFIADSLFKSSKPQENNPLLRKAQITQLNNGETTVSV